MIMTISQRTREGRFSSLATRSQDDQIDSCGDLEDFARLHLVIGGFQKAIPYGTIEVGEEWRDAGQKGGSPSIRIY
jgi:hypothetical protein